MPCLCVDFQLSLRDDRNQVSHFVFTFQLLSQYLQLCDTWQGRACAPEETNASFSHVQPGLLPSCSSFEWQVRRIQIAAMPGLME